MNHIIMSYVDPVELARIGMFITSGLAGMVYAYYRKWSHEIPNSGLLAYMFGDAHATGRALTTFAALCAGAGGLSYLDALTANQIIIAGCGIGLLVPQTVDQKNKGK